MDVISMHQAKSSLSQIVKKAANGAIIYIGAYGKAEAKIIAANSAIKPQKIIGLLKGKIHIPDNFDDSLSDEIISEFEGIK